MSENTQPTWKTSAYGPNVTSNSAGSWNRVGINVDVWSRAAPPGSGDTEQEADR